MKAKLKKKKNKLFYPNLIRIDGKGYNFICNDGKFITENWFANALPFKNGFAPVCISYGGWTFINKNGKIISDLRFDHVERFLKKYAKIFDYYKGHNLIDKEGKLVFKEYFSRDISFVNDNLIKVYVGNRMYRLMDVKTKVLQPTNFNYIHTFKNGLAVISLDFKYNFITEEGKIISEEWFDYAYDGGYATIKRNGESVFLKIDLKGNLIPVL